MTYVIIDKCIRCKFMECIDVCPVDCFYEGENMLVINPEECIDCGVCVPECPIDAIVPDTHEGTEKWVEVNRLFSKEWPRILQKGTPPVDADTWRDVPDKFEKYFSPAPAKRKL